jgi:hypothetical protein
MATTTPNFGWAVPPSTDLVKDGAVAIETLGDSIDASLVDLKGGITGQVLAKASGTDMDFSWVAQDDSNAIQNAIVDAKGDLIAATANDTPARLAVGTNGQVLVADSSTATGLKWANGGKILQVVSATYSTETGSSTSTYVDTGLTATITPSAASSKVLVMLSHNGALKDTNDVRLLLRLYRDATNIVQIETFAGFTNNSDSVAFGSVSTHYVDSPATTSATTYKTQFASNGNAARVVLQANSSVSTIVLMEIGA